MTCITAMVFGSEVFMAGDLMGSNGFTKKVYPDPKVFKNGDFVIGYTDSFRMGQLLQYNWEQPPRLEGLSDREYLQVDVIESMRNTFRAFGYGDKNGVEDIGGNFLIGYKGSIYEMQQNFSILRHDDFAAVGSGQYHAEASLAILSQSIETPQDCVDCLGMAIETAARFTTGVSGEFTWDTTYVMSDEEVEEVFREENNKAIEETLKTLDFSDKEKETFEKVRKALDDSLNQEPSSILDSVTSEIVAESDEDYSFVLLAAEGGRSLGHIYYSIDDEGNLVLEDLETHGDDVICLNSIFLADHREVVKQLLVELDIVFKNSDNTQRLVKKLLDYLKEYTCNIIG